MSSFVFQLSLQYLSNRACSGSIECIIAAHLSNPAKQSGHSFIAHSRLKHLHLSERSHPDVPKAKIQQALAGSERQISLAMQQREQVLPRSEVEV